MKARGNYSRPQRTHSTFRMNPEERERLKRLARRYKMSESAVLRYLIYEADTRRV